MNKLHLGISFTEDFPSEPFESFASEVSHPGLTVRVEARDRPGPQAGMEWLLPTAIVAYIAKPYFDSFLKEAGKDHYQVVKAALKKLALKFAGHNAPVVRRVFAGAHKLGLQPDRYSVVYSIVAVVGEHARIKLLLQPDFTPQECANATESFLAFLEELFDGSFDLSTIDGLSTARPVGGMLLLAFDPETHRLVSVDPIGPTTS